MNYTNLCVQFGYFTMKIKKIKLCQKHCVLLFSMLTIKQKICESSHLYAPLAILLQKQNVNN